MLGMLRISTPGKHSSVEWYWKHSLGCSKVSNSGRRCRDLKGCTKPQWMADGQDLQQHSRVIYYMCMILHLQINTSALEGIRSNLVASFQPLPLLHHDAVGIKEKIGEVIQQLDWKDDTTTAAVIVNGIGGSGKITLGDAVYPSFKYKFQGWKHSKITIIQNPEKDLKVEDLQSLILQDRTVIKQSGRDFENGCQNLKDIVEKESIFVYIDNSSFLDPLKKLLPKDVTSAKKLQWFLTARETKVSGMVENCGIEPCKLYHMECVSIDAALKVLCRKINRKR